MGHAESKPKKPLSTDEVMNIMDRHPEAVAQYYQNNEKKVEKYIVENFWEEDVERWLIAIRGRSPKESLQVRKIDFLKAVNSEAHHTSLYETETLVIRRAAVFDIDVYFGNRNFDQERDDLSVSFSIGKHPTEADNSCITCKVAKPGVATKWFCTLEATDNKTKKVTLRVNVPANAIIGRYSISLDITSGVQGGREKTKFDGATFIVIFNPYAKADTVYMENDDFRNEYVLNDSGFINVGAYPRVSKRDWDFAQFDEGVLDSVLLMLQKDTRMINQPIKTLKKYNSAVFVSRALSAMINCNDDDGVLEGKWAGKKEEYSGGKVPWYWKNSATILLEWRNNNMKPVLYGQCWVFSGLLTTALRAIGIPARCVTNFESAHDTDMNETVDFYYDLDTMEELDSGDSVWNFHVWNEGFFRRPDLPEGYDGWQVLDATPQEESAILHPSVGTYRGLMQCGPAPVKAVKEGDINVGYDTPFVYSEVNADKITWYVRDGEVQGGIKNKRAVGVYIGTKAVGSNDTENIVLQYKYKEGTPEERNAFNKAYGFGTQDHSGAFVNERNLYETSYEVNIEAPETNRVGLPINYKIKIKNASKKKEKITIKIKASSKTHIGQIHASLKKASEVVQIDVGANQVIDFQLSPDDYMQDLVDDYTINVAAVLTSSNGHSVGMSQLDIPLTFPECVTTTLPESVFWKDETKFDVQIKNVFPVKLTQGQFDIAGQGITSHQVKLNADKPILPEETFNVQGAKLKARYGWREARGEIVFDCAEFKNISHSFRIRITQ